jgi:small G protein signaling modulator 3
LLDFQRQEEDELGFNKNDIITIVSETDEHCWVGEINGCRGWFPAKFVEVNMSIKTSSKATRHW